jgi:Glycosidases
VPRGASACSLSSGRSSLWLLAAGWMLVALLGIASPGVAVVSASSVSVQPPDWIYDAVIYQVFPRTFGQEGTFRDITNALPSIRELGVNTLYLMPIHEIGTVRRIGRLGSPYSIRDHLSIDPALGDLEDLTALVDQAHSLGMRVLMDLVPNHTSFDNPLIVQYPHWYRRDAQGNPMPPNPDWQDVAQLDYSVPELRDYMTRVALYWLGVAGIDGFRVDASVYVPLSFWREFYPAVKEAYPEAFLLSESGESWLLQAFDAQYDWEFERLVSRVLQGESAALLMLHLASDRQPFLKVRYLENHDHPRWLGRHSRATTVPAALLLTTVPGIPMIQAGQEEGATRRLSLFDPDRLVTPGDEAVYRVYRELLAVRAAHGELRRGSLRFLPVQGSDRALVYLRGADQEAAEAMLIVVNLSDRTVSLSFSLGEWSLGETVWQGNGISVQCGPQGACMAEAQPFSGGVFKIRRDDGRP